MTTVNPPDLSCYITPPHGQVMDVAYAIPYDGGETQMSFTQNFGRQGDTGTIPIVDDNYSTGVPPNLVVKPSFVIPSFSQVRLVDNNAAYYYGSETEGTLFAGYAPAPELAIVSPTRAEWDLSCVDYSGYMNNSIVQGIYDGIAMGDAIVDLVKKANCGITAATVKHGGFVQVGPNLPRTVIHYTNLTQALQKISNMSSSASAYGWYVDENRNLHFYDQQQAIFSGVTVTDSPTQDGLLSFTECHIVLDGTFKYNYDGGNLYNRSLVVGKTRTITPSPSSKKYSKPNDTFQGNGLIGVFPLSMSPDAAGTPLIIVNGVTQTASYYDGVTAPTTQWFIFQNANGTWSLSINPTKLPIPSAGSVIKAYYPYKTTITAQADLKQSQRAIGGPNNGIFATVVNEQSIQSTASAYARATRDLAEYGHCQEKVTFNTSPEWVGVWRAGQTFILDSKLLLDSQRGFASGLYAKFAITQQTISFGKGGFRTCQIDAVRI